MQENGDYILVLFVVSTLFIVVIVILASLFLIAYQKKMVAQKLYIQRSEMQQQQRLLKAAVEAQEKERKRIASDLHDDIGSLLSALKLNVRHLKEVDVIGDDERYFLDQTAQLLDDGLANVRQISYNLLPPTLVRFGLWEAIRELTQRIDNSNQIEIAANFTEVNDFRLDPDSELSIFRVVQELLSNSLHHSNASKIELSGKCTHHLKIDYQDNGDGITDATQLQGLGMINMRSRLQTLNGELIVSGEDTPYFSAQLIVPLPQKSIV